MKDEKTESITQLNQAFNPFILHPSAFILSYAAAICLALSMASSIVPTR
jgi:hypothetical protein